MTQTLSTAYDSEAVQETERGRRENHGDEALEHHGRSRAAEAGRTGWCHSEELHWDFE
eukprot:CAMPEP_0117553550 /NCGR_PEP_ID=MMETSP0784-20121206/50284_1 /TAXON_ID=39447 /ORGANISM="" /LENGTH=57 /DNA_ID=CAMNT_0005350663 /DNA_START=296 /DNA_END=469 /DNA_ORIENTATION=+